MKFFPTAFLVLCILGCIACSAVSADLVAPVQKTQPFELQQVKLLDGPFLKALELNKKYLQSLDLDRQLHTFRLVAGLPSTAKPLGGWESPEHGGRGEFFGHSLSARALLYAATKDEQLKKDLDYLVAELAKCQQAIGTSGYLHAEPESVFDQLETGGHVEGIYYTVHKLMAGLLDVYHYCGNQQALEVAKKLGNWVNMRASRLTPEHWQKILDVEFGGINESLYNLYAVTKDPVYLEAARRFDHEKIYAPLAEKHDALKGLHANTTIPKIIGAARAYEITGNERMHTIADYFWNEVVDHRCYATGGTSNGEKWNDDPDKLAGQLSNWTQECCCTYNMLKLARLIFGWTADVRAADYYERALYNGILGTQNPETGLTQYHLALAGGYYKTFATPMDSFWCCTGTGVESFAKFGDSIYFHNADTLWVNLFIASELNWKEKGMTVRQLTKFPEEASTALEFDVKVPVDLAVKIRVPYWTTKGITAKINGQPRAVEAQPGSYAEINRTWEKGDRLEIEIPMSLHLHAMPDDKNVAAIMYGPLVLAGCLRDMTPAEINNHNTAPGDPPVEVPAFSVNMHDLDSWIKPIAGKPLEFRVEGQKTEMTLIPINALFGKHYAIYWKFMAKP